MQLPKATKTATFEQTKQSVEYLCGFYHIFKSSIAVNTRSVNSSINLHGSSSIFIEYQDLLKPTVPSRSNRIKYYVHYVGSPIPTSLRMVGGLW